MRFALPIGIIASLSLLLTAPAYAALHTWVGAGGTDTGSCPNSAPCATFAYAFTQTSAGGTINVLSAGSFGPLNITRSVSVIAEGVDATIVGFTNCTGGGSAAVCITAGSSDVVTLRGLQINPNGSHTGILLRSAAALHVHHCAIHKAGGGVSIFSNTDSSVHISNSTITDAVTGIFVTPSGTAKVALTADRVHLDRNNTHGTKISGTGGGVSATLRDSVVSGNGFGILGAQALAVIVLDRTAVTNNTSGIVASLAATVFVGDSTIMGNNTAIIFNGGGSVKSYGTNKVNGNGGGEAFFFGSRALQITHSVA